MTALMWYAALTSACIALAALAAEPLFRQMGKPVRWVWVTALALAVALPALVPLRQALTPAPLDGDKVAVSLTSLPLGALTTAPAVSPAAGDALGLGWLVASALVAFVLVGVHVRYRRVRARWPEARVGGERVLVSSGEGPAVMGFYRPDIVVPRWLLARGEAEQRIVVAHEREHLRAGDPAVLGFGMLAVLLMPWNLAAWFMLARLRLAVELDCDARVLRAGTLPFVYGNLLIDVAALTAGHRLPALALLNPPSQLKRRLIAMHPDRVRFPRVRITVLAAVAAAAVLVACEAAVPTDATVASLDAAKATQAAKIISDKMDSIIYVVDGKQVSADYAEKVKAEDILRTKIQRDLSATGATGPFRENMRADTIVIDTRANLSDRRKAEMAAVMAKKKIQLDESVPDSVKVVEGRSSFDVKGGAEPQVGAKLGAELKSFTGLVYINDELVPSSRLSQLARMNIASVEVIKGAAAVQQYGDRAKAGVIRITTK
ncbi:MAG TPA: M56 family metallopeptidase [Gemmatimonadaceae bacterium]|nr:M56 family metallopeptidase [Gemmatimonadaceae bacterium]